jgi:hypothetical protein
MCMTPSWVSFIPHLSSRKIIFIFANFLALVFGLDDMIGPERTRIWATTWLSAATRFFTEFVSGLRRSAAMLKILAVVFLGTIFAALLLFLVYGLWWRVLGWLDSDHMSVIQKILAASLLPLAVVGLGIVTGVGYFLRSFLNESEVENFLREHSEFLEARVITKISTGIDWAIEETKRYSPDPSPIAGAQVRMPLPGVLAIASIAASVTLIMSLVVRIIWLFMGGIAWLLVFAPAQALNALARRTGAENFIKAGKYVALAALSIYGFFG